MKLPGHSILDIQHLFNIEYRTFNFQCSKKKTFIILLYTLKKWGNTRIAFSAVYFLTNLYYISYLIRIDILYARHTRFRLI